MGNQKKISNVYYKRFLYIIQKKLSVEDNPELKDYAKQGCYLYIIFDAIDKNRFLFISHRHYEENTKIYPETFNLRQISGKKDAILLKRHFSKFSEEYFEVCNEKPDISIIMSDFTDAKKGDKIFRKYKTHTKKIALDYPDWYIDRIKGYNVTSCKKKFKKEVLVDNWYNDEIFDHFISTCFILDDRKFQRFNDHFIVLDQGKTGKSSLIGYLSAKADNISIAGLYGSSDSKAGKFRGGLVTLTDKTIIIDEINELVESKTKGEKILSILNTILENGEYNYVKQFSSKIESSNQFGMLGNISDIFNFPLFLEGCVGNTLTIGRRIGMITYSLDLQGFKKGGTRNPTSSDYVRAVQKYLSKIFNFILAETPFLDKVFSHKMYSELSKYYKDELNKISKDAQNDRGIVRQFILSHAESIDRQIIRALKIYIYDHIDKYVAGNLEFYSNHLPFEILSLTKTQLDKNILNFKNIIDHVETSTITSKKEDYNILDFEGLPKYYQEVLKVFLKNKDIITGGCGISYYDLKENQSVKQKMHGIKVGDFKSKSLNDLLIKYGCRISVILNQDVMFAFINKKLFEEKMDGVIKSKEFKGTPIIDVSTQIKNAWDKKNEKKKDDDDVDTELI